MSRELLRDVVRSRRMLGEIGEHRTALFQSGIWIKLAEHGLVAGFVQAFCERELAAMIGLNRRNPGPASDDFGIARDVLLRVAAMHAERMQLHGFTGE